MSQSPTAHPAAQAELADFINYFNALSDPRPPGKVIYPLQEVLLLSLLATLTGAETFVDMALFGRKKRELLRRFLPFKGGTVSHDHLGDRFATLDAEQFQHCFAAWVAAFTGLPEGPSAARPRAVPRQAARPSCIPSRRRAPASGVMVRAHWAVENSQHWCWIGSFVTTSAGCARRMHPPTSPPSSTWC